MKKQLFFSVRVLFFVSLSLAFIFVGNARSSERVALLIGVNDYKNLSPLYNPIRDISQVAEILSRHGFKLFFYENLSGKEMHDALNSFRRKTKDADEAIIYYSGHGMSAVIDGSLENVIAPVDAQISCADRSAQNVINMNKLFEETQHISKRVFLFDACRNDPFEKCAQPQFKSRGYGFRSPDADTLINSPGTIIDDPRGFQAQSTQSVSALIAFSTDLGALASDGPAGGHSPFATVLIDQLDNYPKKPFRELLDDTSVQVKQKTSFFQVPWVVSKGGVPDMCLSGVDCQTRAVALDQRLVAESRRLASLSREAFQRGDIDAAIALALEGLPDWQGPHVSIDSQPYAVEAVAALEKALRAGDTKYTVSGHTNELLFLSVNALGSRLASSGYDPFTLLWDPKQHNLVAKLPSQPSPYVLHKFNPTGEYIAILGRNKGGNSPFGEEELQIWKTVDGTPVSTIYPDGNIEILDFLDEHRVLLSDQDGIAIWHVLKEEKESVIPTQLSTYVRAFPFANGERLALLSSFSGHKSTLEFWDITNNKLIKSITPHESAVRAAAVSPDGSLLVTGSEDNILKLWDLSTLKVVFSMNLGETVQDADFSYSGDYFVAITSANDGGDIFLWNASKTENPIRHFRDVLPRGGRSVEFGPNEQRLLATSSSARAILFDFEGKPQKQFRSPSLIPRVEGGVSSAIFIDEQTVATGADNGEVTVWHLGGDISLYTSRNELNSKFGSPLEFQRSRKVGWYDYIELDALVERTTGDLKNFLMDSKQSSSNVSYLNQFDDARITVTWNGSNEPIRVWETSSGAQLLELNHQLDWIEAMAYSKDEGVLVAHSQQTNSEGRSETKYQSWPLVRPLGTLISLARDRVLRCLSPEERVAAGLSSELPDWCVEMDKISSVPVDP